MQTQLRILLYFLYVALAILIISVVLYFTSTSDKSGKNEEIVKEETKTEVKLSPEETEGMKLFKDAGCVTCHNLCSKKIGPPLKGISKKRKKEWIHKFVLNSRLLVEQKDPEALAIYNEYGKTDMPPHQFLKPEEIDKIIYYLNSASCE